MTGQYAAIPEEMKRIAKTLGKDVLSQVKKRDFYANLHNLRKRCGDRALLRAMHYFADDDRVTNAVRSLQNGYFSQYLEEITRSGHSSFEYLQNVSVYDDPMHMEVALTIALCEEILGDRGAVRVHGGGFAGTVQAYVPLDMLDDFKNRTEQVLGKGNCHIMQIRSIGGTEVKIEK